MTNIDNGGPAFPRPAVLDPGGMPADQGWLGMSLRDWFAGQALAGMPSSTLGPVRSAERAYRIADAMIKVRTEAE